MVNGMELHFASLALLCILAVKKEFHRTTGSTHHRVAIFSEPSIMSGLKRSFFVFV